MKKGCITATIRKSLCNKIRLAFTKDQTIEHTVNKITQCACIDQRCTNNKSSVIFFTNNCSQVKCSKYYCNQSKKCKNYFTKVATKLPSPGHSFIFYKMQPEPTAKYVMFF